MARPTGVRGLKSGYNRIARAEKAESLAGIAADIRREVPEWAKHVAKALEPEGKDMADQVRATTPVRTGTLLASIQSEVVISRRAGLEVHMNTKTWYTGRWVLRPGSTPFMISKDASTKVGQIIQESAGDAAELTADTMAPVCIGLPPSDRPRPLRLG